MDKKSEKNPDKWTKWTKNPDKRFRRIRTKLDKMDKLNRILQLQNRTKPDKIWPNDKNRIKLINEKLLLMVCRSCGENPGSVSITRSMCSALPKFETWSTSVNADNISIWFKTSFRLVVQMIKSLLPLGGCFFSNTNRVCKVKFEYRGPMGP